MQLFSSAGVTISIHFCRLMTLTPWRTFTPFLLIHLPPQVCPSCTSPERVKAIPVLCYPSSFQLFFFQVSIAATLRSCLGFTTGHQWFRSSLLYNVMSFTDQISVILPKMKLERRIFWHIFLWARQI